MLGLTGIVMVESRGVDPLRPNLQGSAAPRRAPRDGALRLIRTGLLPSSAACNHQIC